jgi:hypothetical protein
VRPGRWYTKGSFPQLLELHSHVVAILPFMSTWSPRISGIVRKEDTVVKTILGSEGCHQVRERKLGFA